MARQTLLAIDPGPEQSAFVVFDGKPREWGILPNDVILKGFCIQTWDEKASMLVIEQIAAMGMAVGAETFETVFWSGRFAEAWNGEWDRVTRHKVKMHLCGSMRAKDANIRQAILDRYGPGKERAIGTVKNKGPLYGVKSHVWSALAVAITWWDTATISRTQ